MSSAGSSIFANARNTYIENSVFNLNSQSITPQSGESGLLELSKYVAANAMHNSSERQPHPKVHPKTRKKILGFIMNWINNPDPEHDVLWLHAPFGHGKTAVMQKIAESLHDSGLADHHAGGFFFGRGKTGRDKANHLIPTISYQIAQNIPGMRQHINQAIINDPTLPLKDINTQLQFLILDPFHRCSPLAHKPIVVVDGIDECTGLSDTEYAVDEDTKRVASHNAQCLVLDTVLKMVSSHHCPLRFLISSRPESHIKHAFRQQQLSQISKPIELDRGEDEDIDTLQNDQEMMEYLRDGFDEIYDRYSDVMSTIEKPWPSTEELSGLVSKASGQYLFAKTVLQFVGSGSDTPVMQLKIILENQHPTSGKAFSAMDNLYTQILQACPGRRMHLHCILKVCVYLHYVYGSNLAQATFAEISNLTIEDVMMSFSGLNALLDIRHSYKHEDTPDDISQSIRLRYYPSYVYVRHISFVEFLSDRKRSGRFHVDIDAVLEWLKDRADILITDGLYGRTHSLHYSTTLDLITSLAVNDFIQVNDDNIANHFPRFPRLEHFLKAIGTQNHLTIPDEPGRGFFESLLITLRIFHTSRSVFLNPLQRYTKLKSFFRPYERRCQDVLDEAWRKTISFSPLLQRIIYTIMIDSDCKPTCHAISDAIGTPLHETHKILEQYSCFEITRVNQVRLLESFQQFLANESRSGPLYIPYRECWIRAILTHWTRFLKEPHKFISDYSCYWQVVEEFYGEPTISNINFDCDLQEGAAMNELIDFLHGTMGGESVTSDNECSVGFMRLLIKWLVRQQKILQSRDGEYTVATKLQGIVDTIDWRNVIYGAFSSVYFLRDTYWSSVPPFGINQVSLFEEQRVIWATELYPYMLMLYSYPPIKEGMISATSHTAITEFFLHTLFHCDVKHNHLVASCVPILVNNVQWHYHLSRAMFSEKILLGILTIHHMFTQRFKNDQSTIKGEAQVKLDIVKQLPASFAYGVVVWLKNHTREDNLEWWCKGIPGMKRTMWSQPEVQGELSWKPSSSSGALPV